MKKFKVIERRNGKIIKVHEFETLQRAEGFVNEVGVFYESTHPGTKTVVKLLRADLYENEGDVFPSESFEIQEND